jgi:uncharacterized protein
VKLFGGGQDQAFYTLLEQQADAAYRAAREFHSMTQDYGHFDQYLNRIDEIEHEADEFTHQLSNKVDSTFVTPLDKEDLHGISTALDDICDAIEDASNTLALYRLTDLRPDVEPLASLMVQITQTTQEAVGSIRSRTARERVQSVFRRIHDLEEQADDAHRAAISGIYHSPDRDPLLFIAWKEVYDKIETAVDLCEDVTNIVESILVKYA